MKYGAQTYAWQMSLDKYRGKIPHILDICERAGFLGLEIETGMLGEYEARPERLKEEFEKRKMTLTAIAVPVPWGIKEKKEILEITRRSLKAAAPFAGTLMSFSIVPPENHFTKREEEQKRFLEFLEQLQEIAEESGNPSAFHTNSSPFSLFWTKEDYLLLEKFFRRAKLGFTPDAGHIAHGGMDVEEIFRLFMPYIRHVHFKDMDRDGAWKPMGDGCIPFGRLLGQLKASGYEGWIAVEEESRQAVLRPDEIMIRNGAYMQKNRL